jgi:ribosomal protein S6--L-glutamate ligase
MIRETFSSTMSKVLILTRNTSTYSHRQLLGAASDLGHCLRVIDTGQFTALASQESYDLVLHRDSGVSFDDVDLLLLRSLASQSNKFVNSPEVISLLRAKDQQYIYFKENNLPCIPTAIFRGADSGLNSFSDHQQFVLKTIRGNQGKGVMLIQGLDSLATILESNEARADQRYILQPKIDFIKEYRVLCQGQEMWGAIEKDLIDDFRANAKRCSAKAIDTDSLPEAVAALASRILKLLPNQFLGLDIGITDNGPLLIEINTTPGFEVFDALHDINSATRLLQELL